MMNSTLEILAAHAVFRKFTDQRLPAGLLETLCTAAQAAATSSFLQGATSFG